MNKHVPSMPAPLGEEGPGKHYERNAKGSSDIAHFHVTIFRAQAGRLAGHMIRQSENLAGFKVEHRRRLDKNTVCLVIQIRAALLPKAIGCLPDNATVYYTNCLRGTGLSCIECHELGFHEE